MAPTKKKGTPSAAHKKAMAQGREQGRVIRRYLSALDAAKPKRGRKRTIESVQKQLNAVQAEIDNGADPLTRLILCQQRIDLTQELARLGSNGSDIKELEEAFVAAAGPYGERRGITYQAWREIGVPSGVLRQAGITTRR